MNIVKRFPFELAGPARKRAIFDAYSQVRQREMILENRDILNAALLELSQSKPGKDERMALRRKKHMTEWQSVFYEVLMVAGMAPLTKGLSFVIERDK